MKINKTVWSVMLMCVVAFFSSCSDDEDVFYYTFKDIEYSVDAGDGMTEYETPWEECFILVNRSETTEVTAGPGDYYNGHHEHYYFECADASLFNPTPGYVHVPLPTNLVYGSQVVLGEEGEYSMDKVEVVRTHSSEMSEIPPMTKLVIERKLTIKRLVLTYKATFQRHPYGKDHVVTGKFVRQIPTGLSVVERFEPISE